jgi:hypothetical protein
MYYLWSLFATTVIFAAIQYSEYKKDEYHYTVYTLTNFITFLIMYMISTIAFYLLLGTEQGNTKLQKGGEYTYIDPATLKKIPDNMYTGFTPYDT